MCLQFPNFTSAPAVTEILTDMEASNWLDQSLEFLEQGRPRALQESILHNPVIVSDGSKAVFDKVAKRIKQMLAEAKWSSSIILRIVMAETIA
jgi:hypothetical protein